VKCVLKKLIDIPRHKLPLFALFAKQLIIDKKKGKRVSGKK